MELRKWLIDNEISQVAFAKQIGYRHTYLNNCLTGHLKPGRKFKEVVEKFTFGKVAKDDWPDKKRENPDQMDLFDKMERDKNGKFVRKKL
jgi:hypothetical protein